ncbi:MAG: hypothetical protein Q4C66_07035 [Lachnospiraceae bacterium]|nr:hypothetical protein [Lachnospiraceae bacterium]
MTNQEFMETVIAERLELVLSDRKKEKDSIAWAKMEEIMNRLEPEDRNEMKQWLNSLADLGADNQRDAYLAGMDDGIWVMGLVLKNFLPNLRAE